MSVLINRNLCALCCHRCPFQVAPELLAEIQSALQQFLTLSPNDDPHFHDKILASGEDNNARLIAGILQASGLAARYLNPEELGILVTDEPKTPGSCQHLTQNQCLGRNRRNFSDPRIFGYTEDGEICTFSRGGSDISGALVAAGVNATLYENFTDVDGIFRLIQVMSITQNPSKN